MQGEHDHASPTRGEQKVGEPPVCAAVTKHIVHINGRGKKQSTELFKYKMGQLCRAWVCFVLERRQSAWAWKLMSLTSFLPCAAHLSGIRNNLCR